LLALLLAVGAGAGLVWQGQQAQQARFAALGEELQHLQQAQRELAAARAAPPATDPAQTALATQVAALEAQLGALTRTLDAQPKPVPLTLDTLALVEATALAALAEQRLLLARDVVGATAALQLAQSRVAPQAPLVALAITHDVARLAAFQDADLVGQAAELAAFARASVQWPLAAGLAAAAVPDPDTAAPAMHGWRAVLAAMWGDLRQLVEIRPAGPALDPLLDPLGAALLRRQLSVELGAVQLAVLARDAPARSAGIEAARATLLAGFASADPQVMGCLTRLNVLANVDLAPPIPTLQESLTALAMARAEVSP
jgi:uroporphyrin-3 C-methyltransferase